MTAPLGEHELTAALNYPARICTELGTALRVLAGAHIPRQAGMVYWQRAGEEFDVLCNVILLAGPLGQTVSDHVALMEEAYEAGRTRNPIGCWVCWFLNWAVQPRHCALMLAKLVAPSPASVYWRAGIAFAVFFGLVGAACTAAWNLGAALF